MLHKRSNFVERRLYEYALHAVCSPLRVIEPEVTTSQLALHVAKLFNVDLDEHDKKYMRTISIQPCPVALLVDVKRARNLLGEDQNGLSDPYCKVSISCKTNSFEDVNGTNIIQTPPTSPNPNIKRTASLFSCATSPSGKSKSKTSKSPQRRHSTQRLSIDRLQTSIAGGNKSLGTVGYRTDIRPKTINPEWNEHFEFEIENINEQYLQITVFDSDRGQEQGMKTVVKEKRGFSRKIRGIRKLFTTGEIDDDFLGQVTIDIKSLASFDREQWFPLTGPNNHRSNSIKSRGEILLGLKVHFKLHEGIKWITETLCTNSPSTPKDDKKARERKRVSNDSVLEFRRRHSALESNDQPHSSIVLRPSVFRINFRPSSIQPQDYARTTPFEDDVRRRLSRNDSSLMPVTDSDSPLLIEEYHQLFRIIALHELEDARELHRDQNNGVVIDWNGSLNTFSHNVLVQFRVLYNISVLSATFIQLLVIMELRCSEDYALFISQGVIEAYLKLFMDTVRQRSDTNDLDFTDYEKTMFKEVFYLFIGHYAKRVHTDALWFLPSKENLPSIQSIIATICTLLQLKICSNESMLKDHLEKTIKTRLRTDINDLFTVNSFAFNDKQDIQLAQINDFVDFVKKLNESMSILHEYQNLFGLFNVNYLKIGFFESNSAADRLAELIECLLTTMTEYFHTLSKPMVRATSSIYDANLIQSSKALLDLYLYVQNIVASIRKNFEPRDWETNAFKLRLINYHQWFSPAMKFLLDGFVALIRQVMERAVEDDRNDVIPEEDIVLHSESSTAPTSLCMKLCREWELLDYPDPIIRYTAMVKLTNTICEQCQHYARRIARKLSENIYFTDLDRTRSFNVSRKLCMLVNDIEYVKTNVLSSLPKLLNFSNVIAKMVENYPSDDFRSTELTLERLINTAEREMNDVIKLIFERVADLVHETLQIKIGNYYKDVRRGKSNSMEDINRYIDRELLQNLYRGLEQVQYSRVACAIRIKVIQCLKELLPIKEPPEFFQRVLQSFDQLAVNLDLVCREEPLIPSPPCDEVTNFRRILQTYALTTEQLQLSYFRELCQVPSPHEHSNHNGEIVFRAAYEKLNDLVTIYVYIVACRNLPKMDLIGSSDPYVIIELLPHSLFNKPIHQYQTTVQKRTLNPEYNEPFQWYRLPTNVLHERGAVLRLSVWDKDIVNDDFIGECFVPLPTIVPLKNLAALRDVPVSAVRLRRPRRNIQPQAFELIRNRATFDTEADRFVKQRLAVTDVGNGSDTASIMSDDRNSSGSYTSNALRSLLCMLPFNIGFGFDATGHDRSDIAEDEEII